MAKRSAKCPQCGNRVEVDSKAGEHIVCSQCQAHLTVNIHKTGERDKPAAPADPLIGKTLGEFEMIDLLGRGGMGAVYKAHQPSLGRMVAVKVLSKDHSRDAAYVGRFDREARAAAAVNHPNIIEIYSVGEDDGYHYIAMEFVAGETLGDVLRRDGPLPPDRAVDIMKQVAAALAEAHAAGIVHRDIKPSNILLTPRGGVKVADFGLAKRPDADIAITKAGKVLGTPLYMPPEVLRGQDFEPRSDLYSLGATFYHVLAGRPPFEGRTSSEIAVKQVREQVPPLAQIAPRVPRALRRVIHRLLSKAPADRYPTAAAVLETLEYIDADMAASKPPSGSGPPIPAAKRRVLNKIPTARKAQVPKALIAGVAAGVVALAVILVVVLLPKDQPAPQKPFPAKPDPKPPGPVAVTPKPKPPTPKPKPPTPKPKPSTPKPKPPTPKPIPPTPVSEWTTLRNGWRVGKAVDLGPVVNSPANDGAPCLDRDGLTLFFASDRPGGQGGRDLWMCTRPSAAQPWGRPRNLGAPVNGPVNDNWPCLSADGLTLLFVSSRPGGRGGSDLWMTGRASPAEPWTAPRNLGPTVNSSAVDETLCLSADGLTLLFASEREGGQGDMDLWMSTRPSPTAPWAAPRNLAPPINGPGADRSPRLSSDGLTMIFSSNRKGSPRRYDLWMTVRRTTSEPFGNPVNVGAPINSGGGEADPMLSWDNRWLYFESNRPGTRGGFDIWRVPLLPPGVPLPTAPPDDDDRWTPWQDLFDGKTIDGWKVVRQFPGTPAERGGTGEGGQVHVKDGCVVLGPGNSFTGIALARQFAAGDFELALDAQRLTGSGDMVSIAFPTGRSRCSLVVGGSDNTVVGLQLVDGKRCDVNATTRRMSFVNGRWYAVRLRVTADRIEAWIDGKQVVDFPTADRELSIYPPWRVLDPLGLAASNGTSLLRSIRLRRLKPARPKPPAATRPAKTTRPAKPPEPTTQARPKLDARWAADMESVEVKVAAWDFAGADAELAKLKFQDKGLAARLAIRRDEAARLARLKARIVAQVNEAKPWLRKGQAVVPGSGGKKFKAVGEQIASADDNGVTLRDVKAVGEKSRRQTWAELDKRVLPKLLALAVSADNADDQLAAGLLALVRKDAATAERHFERARTLGAKIDRYLGPLAAVALANAKALLDAKKYTEADKALAALAKKYAKTPWFASHKDELDAVRARVKLALANAEAEKLYAQAVKLFEKKAVWDLKPLVEKLKTNYPKTAPVTDTKRTPSFEEMAKALEGLGKFLTVRQDGKGDHKTIQAAIDAAPPNSLIEIQDNGPYREALSAPKEKKGLALRGGNSCWPIITSGPSTRKFSYLLQFAGPGVLLERLVIVRAPDIDRTCAVQLGPGSRLRGVIIAEKNEHGYACRGNNLVVENSFITAHGLVSSRCNVRNSILIGMGGLGADFCENVVIKASPLCHLFERFKARFCTFLSVAPLARGGGVFLDCIIPQVDSAKPDTKIDNCNVFGSRPFLNSAKAGKRCFGGDPQFRDPDNWDYRLKPTSPCRGKASDGGDVGCRYTPEMIEILKKALELRKNGIIKF